MRLKKYLYALRPLLCFRYVEQYRKVAPVPFDKLCAAVLPDSMRGAVDDLLAQKKQAREKETAPRIPELDAYLLAEFPMRSRCWKRCRIPLHRIWGG